jgi:alkanesulfonate monooxygenase SsuD/methylene tetrahydromethanopterin reductase-like flavin-dependent oxidoreductase (luciferase family)
MKPTFGVHIGQQNMTAAELRALWRKCDEAKVDWISVWDHLYEAPPAGGTLPHFETLTTLGALAADTRHARLGVLVLYPGYRNPALLARAATTLDHLSGGRFVMGLGAGWHVEEALAHGYPFPELRDRLDLLEESIQLIRAMLTQPRSSFEGRHARTANVSCLPAPLQKRLPLWIGGTGRKRTLRIAARFADGWNAAYVGPEEYAQLNRALDQWCEREGRDPKAIERSVNLSFQLSADAARAAKVDQELRERWGDAAVPRLRAGSLVGTPDQAAKRVNEYLQAGAQNVNVAMRAPWDAPALDAYVREVIPALQRQHA